MLGIFRSFCCSWNPALKKNQMCIKWKMKPPFIPPFAPVFTGLPVSLDINSKYLPTRSCSFAWSDSSCSRPGSEMTRKSTKEGSQPFHFRGSQDPNHQWTISWIVLNPALQFRVFRSHFLSIKSSSSGVQWRYLISCWSLARVFGGLSQVQWLG